MTWVVFGSGALLAWGYGTIPGGGFWRQFRNGFLATLVSVVAGISFQTVTAPVWVVLLIIAAVCWAIATDPHNPSTGPSGVKGDASPLVSRGKRHGDTTASRGATPVTPAGESARAPLRALDTADPSDASSTLQRSPSGERPAASEPPAKPQTDWTRLGSHPPR